MACVRALRLPVPYTQCARTTASSPETHLELHGRLADHREQLRRQRDQLRREIRVRHTGSDRRQRLPVPREQHRHEQLQPLQQCIRSFAHMRSSRQEGRRLAFLAAYCPVCTPVAVYP